MQKDFDRWNKKKKQLHASTFTDYVNEREVWWCALGANIGVEMDGKHDNFERPVLVLRKFSKSAVLVVPTTTKVKNNKYYIPYIHRRKKYAAMVSQIRLVSTKRFLRRVFTMDRSSSKEIRTAVNAIIYKRSPR